jgi:hypothetical protein
MNPDEKTIARMNWLFYASFFMPALGLVLALVGMIARSRESSAHWGVWVSLAGWTLVIGGFLLRGWVRYWFRKVQKEP